MVGEQRATDLGRFTEDAYRESAREARQETHVKRSLM